VQPAAVRLGIDYGAETTAAVLDHGDGRVLPLLLDASPVMPSGVFVPSDDGPVVAGLRALHLALERPDCYVDGPRQHLTDGHVQVAGRHLDAVDLVAATLWHVVDEAARAVGGPVVDAAITVPAGWGPHRRTLLREAASRAGLDRTDLVADPVAAAAWLASTNPLPDGACVLVCDAGATAVVVSVVQYEQSRWQVLATNAIPGSGGHDIDDAIATHAAAATAADQPDSWARLRHPETIDDQRDRRLLWDAARQAKQTLWYAPSAVVALPAPHTPAVLDQQQLAVIAAQVLKDVPAAVDDVLAAADVEPNGVAAAVLVGGGARLPGLVNLLADRVHRSPVLPDRPDHLLADGAVRATTNRPVTVAPRVLTDGVAPIVRLRPRTAVAPIAFFAGSVAVLSQALFDADIYGRGLATTVVTNTAGFAVAATLAVLTGLAAAHLVVTGASVVENADQTAPVPGAIARLLVKGYAGGATIGVTVAAIYGLLAGAAFGLVDNPYPRWCLFAAVPVAAIAVANALLATRLPAPALREWLDVTRQPVLPVVLAALGSLAMWAYLAASPSYLPFAGLLGRLGAATTGIAIALTVTRVPLLRWIVGTVLAVGAAAVLTLANSALIQGAYVVAVGWWWVVRLVRTGTVAIPHTLPAARRWLGRSGG
jgi:hypothetical protein